MRAHLCLFLILGSLLGAQRAQAIQPRFECQTLPGGLLVSGARPRSELALRRALSQRELLEQGLTWLGKLRGAGGRDVLIFLPARLELDRPVELIVFMEGFMAFSEASIARRHVQAIERLIRARRNAIYVAPEVPSSVHGPAPTHPGPYWAPRAQGEGPLAPGDFIAFYKAVQAWIEVALCSPEKGPPQLKLALIGFSNGGRGIREAVQQLAAARGAVQLGTVALERIVFADANYGRWLEQTWALASALPSLKELSILLLSPGRGSADNRRRAADFMKKRRDPRLHLAMLKTDHEGAGDLAPTYRP